MTWTAPHIDRLDGPTQADERTQLDAFLEYHRQTFLWKCSGLTGEQLKIMNVEPSNISLLGLMRHLTDVERAWFTVRLQGNQVPFRYWHPDGDTDWVVADADAEADYGAYLAECEASRAAVEGLSLEHTFVHPRTGKTFDLRWVYIHLIEEYARHNGHADLVRERIDGATGE